MVIVSLLTNFSDISGRVYTNRFCSSVRAALLLQQMKERKKKDIYADHHGEQGIREEARKARKSKERTRAKGETEEDEETNRNSKNS